MERHPRQLDDEGDEEAQHEQEGVAGVELSAEQVRIGEGDDAAGIVVQVNQRQDGEQHQQPADLREQEELHRRVGARLMPPNGDQEVHGDQHHFPEHEEQEQVQRGEHANHPGEGPQQVELEEAGAFVDFGPGGDDGDQAQKQGQGHHGEAEPVHRQDEVDPEARYPSGLLLGPYRNGQQV